MTEQVTMRQLLVDEIFRKWMTRKPEFPHPETVRWRLYVQREEGGPWAKRDVESYGEGYRLLAENFKRWHDCALVCLGRESRPPVVRKAVKVKHPKTGKMVKGYKRVYHKPMISVIGHRWCGYCRRPTVFRSFSKHHALPHFFKRSLLWEPRCTICGIREVSIKRY